MDGWIEGNGDGQRDVDVRDRRVAGVINSRRLPFSHSPPRKRGHDGLRAEEKARLLARY